MPVRTARSLSGLRPGYLFRRGLAGGKQRLNQGPQIVVNKRFGHVDEGEARQAPGKPLLTVCFRAKLRQCAPTDAAATPRSDSGAESAGG